MGKNYDYVVHNKCKGGKAFEDMVWDDGECYRKVFCIGIEDAETDELSDKCKECPRLLFGKEWEKWAETEI